MCKIKNTKSIIRGFSTILGIFSQYKILISLNCAFDSEWNGVIKFVVSCSIVKLFIPTTINHLTKDSKFAFLHVH